MKCSAVIKVLVILCLIANGANAQNFTQDIDNLYQHLDKSPISTGVLYDRVVPYAKVNAFNWSQPDTSGKNHFKQAYFEMFHAAYNQSGWITIDTLNNRVSNIQTTGHVPIAIGLYTYQFIDTNAVVNNQIYLGGDSLFYDVPNRSSHPFVTRTSVVASPMIDSVFCAPTNQVFFNFSNNLLLNQSGFYITSLQVDFDNGSGFISVSTGSDIAVFYPATMTGIRSLKFLIGLSNGTMITTYAQLKVISAQQVTTNGTPGCAIGETTQYVFADTPFQGYDESSAKYGVGLMTIYHATNPCDGVIRKPIIVVDGFDPSGTNTANKIRRTLNIQSPASGSIGLADYLQSQGYDLVILDFPTSGADYIERNSMILVKALDMINNQKSGSEKNILIGPSMGGLISRYALAYMEQHSKPHQVKLYVSFDSPHQGANVPLADQYFLDYLKDDVASARENLEQSINSPAAKQMLLNHYLANSTTLAGAPNFRNTFIQTLNNIGWPAGDPGQPFRKIAVTDGSLGGTLNTQPCGLAFGFEVNLRTTINFLFHFSFENLNYTKVDAKFTPNYGNTCDIFRASKFKFFSNPLTLKYFTTSSNTAGVDNAPGGFFNTQQQIADQGNGVSTYIYGGDFKAHFNSVVGTHSFINTKSSLAFSGANQDLAENISDRSLVCTGETPFDSYYGDFGVNREHVTLWDGAVDYLLKEISGIPQLPPFTGGQTNASINGPASFCSSTIYTVDNLPSGSNVTWTVTTGPATVSQSGNTATLNVVNSDHGYVTLNADIISSCGHYAQTKTLYAGAFAPSDIYGFVNNGQVCGNSSYNASVSPGYSTYEWTVSGGTVISGQNTPEVIYLVDPYSTPNQQMYITCHVYDECGRPIAESPIEYATVTDCGPGGGISSRMSNYPNPADNTITISANNKQSGTTAIDNTSQSNNKSTSFNKQDLPITNFSYTILDKFGNTLRQGSSNKAQDVSIDTRNITSGNYFLHLFVNKEVIKRQIIIAH